MKYALLLILLPFVFACKSSKSSTQHLQEMSVSDHRSVTTQRDSIRTETADSIATTVTTNTQEFIRTTNYRDDGTISAVQEQWRRTGTTLLATGTRQKTEVSVTELSDTTHIAETTEKDLQQHTEIKTDSRLIQGSDWLFIIFGLLVAFGIFRAIYLCKNKKT